MSTASYHTTSPHADTHTMYSREQVRHLHLVEITDDRLSLDDQPSARFYIVHYDDVTGDMTARRYWAKGWQPQAVAYVAEPLTKRQAERRFNEIIK